MPGPQLRSTFSFDIPAIESGKVYAPGSIARRLLNLRATPEGTLASVRGPCTYETGSKVVLGRVHGMCQVSTLDGANDVLLLRAGPTLYMHAGWAREWVAVTVGVNADCTNGTLNDDQRQPYPDVMLPINGKIVWSNGIDRPRVVDAAGAYGARMNFLGFDRQPGAPTGFGPAAHMDEAASDNAPDTPPNWFGYSHQGRIGTIGDELVGQDGNMRAGGWFYYSQMEDYDGNLSPLSPASNVVTVQTQSTSYDHPTAAAAGSYRRYNTTDDLTRQFLVKGGQSSGSHCAYQRFYRTPDTRHYDVTPRLLVRIPGNGPICYPDNIPDGLLLAAPTAQDLVAVPKFRVACEYQGRLVAANTSAAPGVLYVSEPGFLGTFQRKYRVIPDPTGAEILGVFSSVGGLYALTAHSLFRINIDPDGLRAEPISRTIGCVAPKSVCDLPDGSVIWLARDGFYRFDGSQIARISDQIYPLTERINKARVGLAVAVFDSGEYLCAVPMDGSYRNDRLVVYDVEDQGFREQAHGIHYRALLVTNDHRAVVLGAGYNTGSATNDVFMLDHESATFTPPTKTYRFDTNELRVDPSGRRRGNISTLYLGFIEAETPLTASLTWWRDGRRDGGVTQLFSLVDVDLGTQQTWGTALLGTTPFRTPKLFWRKADLTIPDCTSFRFELSIAEPGHMTLVGICFDADLTDKKGSRVPLAES